MCADGRVAFADCGRRCSSTTCTNSRRTLFQPVGGMGRIGEAFGRELGDVIQLQRQGHAHRAGRHTASPRITRTRGHPGSTRARRARTGVCARFRCRSSSQIPMNVGACRWPRRSRRCRMRHRRRSACSSSAASGSRTSRSTVASRIPTCRSSTISYPSSGSSSAGPACCSAPTTGGRPRSSSPR